MRPEELLVSKSPIPTVGIVGRNLGAALLAWRLSQNQAMRLSWFQTFDDQKNTAAQDWVCLPFPLEMIESTRDAGLRSLKEAYFYKGSRRFRFSNILNSLQFSPATLPDFPVALWKKIITLNLLQDPTPIPLDPRNRDIVDVKTLNWVAKTSHYSFSEKNYPVRYSLIPREKFLKYFESLLVTQSPSIEIVHGNQGVIAVQPRTNAQDTHKLVNNAPFGITLRDNLVWGSYLSPLREEIDQRGSKRLHRALTEPYALWKVWGGFFDSGTVSSLPAFSVHLDEKRSQRFLKTGILESGCFKRVLTIPPEWQEGESEKVWLQIESLVVSSENVTTSELETDFLNELAPQIDPDFLKELPIRDENLIFQNPTTEILELTTGILAVRPHFLDSYDKLVESLLTQLKIPRSLNAYGKTNGAIDATL
jgi:hypothetical protein